MKGEMDELRRLESENAKLKISLCDSLLSQQDLGEAVSLPYAETHAVTLRIYIFRIPCRMHRLVEFRSEGDNHFTGRCHCANDL
jgi:hypothetical protein